MFGFIPGLALRRCHSGNLSSRIARSGAAAATCCVTRPYSSSSPTIVRARHILVESEAMIDSVADQLASGKGTFDSLASIVSTCPSKAKGGDLGWFRRNMMVKAFEEAAFSNPPGSVVKVQTEFGWHLIKVEEHGNDEPAMTVVEYAARVQDGSIEDVQRIDCREAVELEKASLPGFLNLPMGEYGRWADDLNNGKLNLDKDKETVVMCHHGIRSQNFCNFLRQQGFSIARNLSGGIDAYSVEIDPSIPRY